MEFSRIVGIMSALIDLTWNSDFGLYLWTGILIVVILGVAFPLTIYQQKIVKRRWQAVTEFLEHHQGQIPFRPHHMKQQDDVLVPVFSGFLIHGHFTYICLDPAQDRATALSSLHDCASFVWPTIHGTSIILRIGFMRGGIIRKRDVPSVRPKPYQGIAGLFRGDLD